MNESEKCNPHHKECVPVSVIKKVRREYFHDLEECKKSHTHDNPKFATAHRVFLRNTIAVLDNLLKEVGYVI